ncbi:hypothetical protein [Streptomyces violens]|uniref:hypothetical protein n=1 Tax=Streptomyces violens TaxID=66377 RepID=UPI0004C1407A|nr:hypothetical protein [Streptomyces violens]
MEASVWVGAVFGLVGTGIGGALSIWSAVMTQRQQAAHTREEQRQARASAAVEAALTELFEIQRDARRAGPDSETRRQQLHERVLNIQVLMQRVPDAGLRDRVREASFFLPLSPAGDTRSREERRVDSMYLCADAIACLGAYLRAEAMPARTGRVEEIRALWPFPDIGSDGETIIYEAED